MGNLLGRSYAVAANGEEPKAHTLLPAGAIVRLLECSDHWPLIDGAGTMHGQMLADCTVLPMNT